MEGATPVPETPTPDEMPDWLVQLVEQIIAILQAILASIS